MAGLWIRLVVALHVHAHLERRGCLCNRCTPVTQTTSSSLLHIPWAKSEQFLWRGCANCCVVPSGSALGVNVHLWSLSHLTKSLMLWQISIQYKVVWLHYLVSAGGSYDMMLFSTRRTKSLLPCCHFKNFSKVWTKPQQPPSAVIVALLLYREQTLCVAGIWHSHVTTVCCMFALEDFYSMKGFFSPPGIETARNYTMESPSRFLV